MRDHAGGKNQSCFLRCSINRAQQTAASKARPARLGVNGDLTHFREVNHHAAIARAEAGKAMPATADSSKKSRFTGGPDGILEIARISAACDQSRRARKHAIPDEACVFIAAVAGTQQIAFELPMKRRVDLFAGFNHCVLSMQKCPAKSRRTCPT